MLNKDLIKTNAKKGVFLVLPLNYWENKKLPVGFIF